MLIYKSFFLSLLANTSWKQQKTKKNRNLVEFFGINRGIVFPLPWRSPVEYKLKNLISTKRSFCLKSVSFMFPKIHKSKIEILNIRKAVQSKFSRLPTTCLHWPKLIIAVTSMYTTWAAVKLKPEKNWALNRIQTHGLCDTGVVLYQLSCQTNRELVTLLVHNIP